MRTDKKKELQNQSVNLTSSPIDLPTFQQEEVEKIEEASNQLQNALNNENVQITAYKKITERLEILLNIKEKLLEIANRKNTKLKEILLEKEITILEKEQKISQEITQEKRQIRKELSGKLENENSLNNTLQNLVTKLEDDLQNATSNLEEVNKKNQELENKKLEQEEENQQLNKTLEDTRQTIKQLEEKIKQQEKTISDQTQQLTEKNAEIQNLQKQTPQKKAAKPITEKDYAFLEIYEKHEEQAKSTFTRSGVVIENNKNWITKGAITNPKQAKQVATFFVEHYVKSHASFFGNNTFSRYINLLLWATVNYVQIDEYNKNPKRKDSVKSLEACKAIFTYLKKLPSTLTTSNKSLSSLQRSKISAFAKVYESIAVNVTTPPNEELAEDKLTENKSTKDNLSRLSNDRKNNIQQKLIDGFTTQAESKTSFDKKMPYNLSAFILGKNFTIEQKDLLAESLGNGKNLKADNLESTREQTQSL